MVVQVWAICAKILGDETVESVRVVTGDSQGVVGGLILFLEATNFLQDTITPMAENPKAIHTYMRGCQGKVSLGRAVSSTP